MIIHLWFPSRELNMFAQLTSSQMGHLQLRRHWALGWRWWKIKSADPSQCALLSLTLSVTALGWGLQVVRGWGEVSIYLVVQWRRRDLLGFECHPVTRCTFFPCIIGPDDSSWKLPVNNLEVMSFIDSHIVFNLWLKSCGRKSKRIYK